MEDRASRRSYVGVLCQVIKIQIKTCQYRRQASTLHKYNDTPSTGFIQYLFQMNVITSPIIVATIIISTIFSTPVLALFTLPLFFVAFPRTQRFWPIESSAEPDNITEESNQNLSQRQENVASPLENQNSLIFSLCTSYKQIMTYKKCHKQIDLNIGYVIVVERLPMKLNQWKVIKFITSNFLAIYQKAYIVPLRLVSQDLLILETSFFAVMKIA